MQGVGGGAPGVTAKLLRHKKLDALVCRGEALLADRVREASGSVFSCPPGLLWASLGPLLPHTPLICPKRHLVLSNGWMDPGILLWGGIL